MESGYEINYLARRSFHQGELPNFAGNFTRGISQLYGMDRNIFHIAKPLARKSTKAIFSLLWLL